MPVKLLTGSSRSGKTERIVELYLDATRNGSGALLLVPDEGVASDLRRRILDEVGGFFDGGITTFEAWAEHFLGIDPELVVSAHEEEESLVLRGLAGALNGKLGDDVLRGGFRHAALGWIEELRESGITPDGVRSMVAALDTASPRLSHLATFLARFTGAEAVAGIHVRTALPMVAAKQLADGDPAETPSLLLVDGFHRFSEVRLALLAALSNRSRETWVTLPAAAGAEHWLGDALDRVVALLAERFDWEEITLPPSGDVACPEVHHFGGASREEEVDRIAREILRGCRERGRTPEDHLVLMRSLAGYRDPIESVFRRRRIPYSARFRTSLAATAGGRSLLEVVGAIEGSLSRDSVRPLFKNRMFGGSPDRADRVIREWRQLPECEDPRGARDQIAGIDPGFAAEQFDPLIKMASEVGAEKGGAVVEELHSWWSELIDGALRADVVPDAERALFGASVERAARLLEKSARMVRDMKELRDLPAAEVLSLVVDEVAAAQVDYLSGGRGGVRIDDYRHGENRSVPVVFLPGLSEDEVPRSHHSGAFWTEVDRSLLSETGQFRLHDRSDHRAEERFLFRRALDRGTEQVWLSRAVFGSDGGERGASSFLDEIVAEFPDRVVHGSVERWESLDSIQEKADLLPYLSAHMDGVASSAGEISAVVEVMRDLSIELPPPPRGFHEPVRFDQFPLFREWIKNHDLFSISELEEFQVCAFRYLAKFVYRLGDRIGDVQFAFSPGVEGEALHEAMEGALREGENAADCAGRSLDNSRGDFPEMPAHRLSSSRWRDAAAEMAESELQFHSRHGWKAEEFEIRFGGGEEDPLPAGGGAKLAGRIDRLDIAEEEVAVVDYKRTVPAPAQFSRDLAEGRSLALPLYLLAAEGISGKRAAGAYLLAVPQGKEPRRIGIARRGAVKAGLFPEKMRGGKLVILADDAFREALANAKRSAASAIDAIRSGVFPVNPPSKDTCDRLNCEFRDLCRVVVAAIEERP